MIDEGSSELEIANEHFGHYIRHYKAFREYRVVNIGNRDFLTTVVVIWGESGFGKTSWVAEQCGPDTYWLTQPNGPRAFWDGYIGQENVVIDEFYGWLPRQLLYRLCDRQPLRVETKMGSFPFVSKKIYITSNDPPFLWWPSIGIGAMRRRLSDPDRTLVERGLEPSNEEEVALLDQRRARSARRTS